MALIDKLRSLAADGVFARQKNDDLKMLEDGIDLLRASTCYGLQKKFIPTYGPEKAPSLASAVISSMLVEPPTDVMEKFFYEKNLSAICQEAIIAHKQEGIAGPSGCASYLYAAKILHATITSEATASSQQNCNVARLLQKQAADLNIAIPTTTEICGSDNRTEAIRAIYSFAKAFYYTNTWSGNSLAVTEPLPSIPYDDEDSALQETDMDRLAS